MGFTCKICNFSHSCWCGGKKCKCGMNLGQARIADRVLSKYNIEDTAKLVELVKEGKSMITILSKLGIDTSEHPVQMTEKPTVLDKKLAWSLGMKSVYCEYDSLSDDAKCKFCGRRKKEGYLQPCLYYLEHKK